MQDPRETEPDNTAVRVALWRGLHLDVDAPPHVFADDVGVKLVAPEAGWQNRGDMSPFTRLFRASTVAGRHRVRDHGFPQAIQQRR